MMGRVWPSRYSRSKPFVERLEEAARNRPTKENDKELDSELRNALLKIYQKALSSEENESPEGQAIADSGTDEHSIMSPRLTNDPAADEKIRQAVQQWFQNLQQEAMKKSAVEYYRLRLEAAQSLDQEELGLFEKVVGNEASARIAEVEKRLEKLESLLEKVLSKLDDQ